MPIAQPISRFFFTFTVIVGWTRLGLGGIESGPELVPSGIRIDPDSGKVATVGYGHGKH